MSSSLPPKTLFVLGAGVDYPLGVPTMATLMQEMRAFATGDGKPVHKALHENAPRHSFTFAREARRKGEEFGETILSSDPAVAQKVLDILAPHATDEKPGVKAIHTVVQKLAGIREQGWVDEGTAKALHTVAGWPSDEGGDVFILNTRGMGLNPLVREAMGRVFRGIEAEDESLSDKDKEILAWAASTVENVERMMARYFIGFFANSPADQKNYYYLAWMLWAFIRLKQGELYANRDHSLYRVLEEIGAENVLTFNYTDFFFDGLRDKVHYFHGDSNSYLRFDTRDLVTEDDAIRNARTVEEVAKFIRDNKPDWTCIPSRVILPGIIPPVALKPIVSQQNLKNWYDASVQLQEAERIVIVGYSFAIADEHFNQLLRSRKPGCKVVVVNPDTQIVPQNVCRVLGQRMEDLQTITKAQWSCRRGDGLLIVPGKSDELNADTLLSLLT